MRYFEGAEIHASPKAIPILRGKARGRDDAKSSCASRSPVLCSRPSLARIVAEFPIQNSWPSSAGNRSNQCSGPVASTPTRTGFGRVARACLGCLGPLVTWSKQIASGAMAISFSRVGAARAWARLVRFRVRLLECLWWAFG
jgi:hypothetical protein